MKRLIITLSSLLALASMQGIARETADTLLVMSYNLRFGEISSMEKFSEAIRDEAPDFVMLQECDWATSREGVLQQHGVRFVNELARGTGMFGLFGKTIDFAGGYYGIGLLSRYPIISSRRVLLPCDGKTEQRCILIADVELPSSRIVTVASTHLDHTSEEIRIRQAEFIDSLLQDNPYPVILAGDMNSKPSSDEIGILKEDWTDVSDTSFTFSTSFPHTKIDYIFVRPASCFEILHSETLRRCRLSDHFPITARLAIEDKVEDDGNIIGKAAL